MSVYGTKPPIGLRPGDVVVLSNAALGGAVLTQQVRIDPDVDGSAKVTLYNHSAASLTVEVADVDSGAANYLPLINGDTGQAVTVAAGKASSFTTTAKFLAVLPSADPGATVISIGR
jgi:hypothetical protein